MSHACPLFLSTLSQHYSITFPLCHSSPKEDDVCVVIPCMDYVPGLREKSWENVLPGQPVLAFVIISDQNITGNSAWQNKLWTTATIMEWEKRIQGTIYPFMLFAFSFQMKSQSPFWFHNTAVTTRSSHYAPYLLYKQRGGITATLLPWIGSVKGAKIIFCLFYG